MARGRPRAISSFIGDRVMITVRPPRRSRCKRATVYVPATPLAWHAHAERCTHLAQCSRARRPVAPQVDQQCEARERPSVSVRRGVYMGAYTCAHRHILGSEG
eukprot:scaffold309_cov575-Prasinococcus_capsulatus_cf.AAC.1